MRDQLRYIIIVAAVAASVLGVFAIFSFRTMWDDADLAQSSTINDAVENVPAYDHPISPVSSQPKESSAPEYAIETIDVLSIKRTEGEIQFIEQLSEEEFESLVDLLWKHVFSGELDNTTAITLEFSLLLDHDLGLQIDQSQRVALIAAHRQMMARKHGYGTTTGPVTTPEGIEEIYSEFEEKVEQILNDPDLVDQLLN